MNICWCGGSRFRVVRKQRTPQACKLILGIVIISLPLFNYFNMDLTEQVANGQSKTGQKLPLLYQSLTPISRDQHQELTYDNSPGYLHAATNNALPILVNEFNIASRDYPIFFSNLKEPVPLVAVGPHNENRNMFIDGEGQWKTGLYIPTYLKRYPFLLVKSTQQQEESDEKEKGQSYLLAFDDKAPHFHTGSGTKLMDEATGKPLIETFVTLCRDYAQAGNVTQAFIKVLLTHDLLAWKSLTRSKGGDSEPETIFSFVAVNSDKLTTLSDTVITELFRKGWLSLIYAHLFSLENWQRILAEDL